MSTQVDLDDDIASLKARVETLKSQLRLQTNALLTCEPVRQAIVAERASKPLQDRLEKQQAYKQQCLYRACAGVTTFRVRDPDPNAVNKGNVLGIRVEVMTRAKFLRPYYVLLNQPYSGSERTARYLRVHRHTVPPCIPLNGLAARYLPAPKSSEASGEIPGDAKERLQDLSRFVRCLRREIVRYHNRVAVIQDLRKAVGLDGKRRDAEELAQRSSIAAISAADAEAKQVRVDWKDGRSGRLIVGDDGEVIKFVVFGESGQDRELTRELLSDGSRIEDVARRLSFV